MAKPSLEPSMLCDVAHISNTLNLFSLTSLYLVCILNVPYAVCVQPGTVSLHLFQ